MKYNYKKIWQAKATQKRINKRTLLEFTVVFLSWLLFNKSSNGSQHEPSIIALKKPKIKRRVHLINKFCHVLQSACEWFTHNKYRHKQHIQGQCFHHHHYHHHHHHQRSPCMVSTRSISDNLDKKRKIFFFLCFFTHVPACTIFW